MPVTLQEAKKRLDYIINIGRVDLYKPIQIAEVLYQSRTVGGVRPLDLDSYRNPSIHWRDAVTLRLSNKASTSSARYQHDVWNPTAMPPEMLATLDTENKQNNGAVERYVYMRYGERQGTVTGIITAIEAATPMTFQLSALLDLFVRQSGIRRSIDKAYEIVAHSLFETVVTELKVTVKVSAPPSSQDIIKEFSDLTRVLLGLDQDNLSWEQPAHVYRVGVTNAADRGLDMWANFGPAVQVKHLTLNDNLANEIIDQVESDHIVIVCRDAEAAVIQTVIRQIGWGRRVRGIVREADLIEWYERCLRGKFKDQLAHSLLERLTIGFKAEFPQTRALAEFLEERSYASMIPPDAWKTTTDEALSE